MKIKKISFLSKDYLKYKTLQKNAFPPEEQYPFWMLRLLSIKKGVEYLAFYDDDQFCGLAYTSSTSKVCYILYLAIETSLRSHGYGTKILDLLKEKNHDKAIVLNVEPLDKNAANYEQRKKRIDFYYRNGFINTKYQLVDITGNYDILSTSKDFSVDEYKKAIKQIGMGIYKPKVKQNSKL